MIGVSKAGFGGGTGILVMPVLALMIDPRESLGLMLPLLLSCDIMSLYFFWGQWETRNLALLSSGAALAAIFPSPIAFWWYGAFTCIPTLVIGALASLLFPPPAADKVDGLMLGDHRNSLPVEAALESPRGAT